jgi:hypothetical protein
MSTSSRLVAALAVTVLLGTQARAQSERALKFLAKQCNEDAIEMRLDPRPFQGVVGSEFSLALEEGKARVVIIVQDCPQYWIDGEDLGPAQDAHVWVSIHGLEDLRPVVGAQRTRPTRTWFTLVDGSSNPRVREARGAAGTAQTPVGSLVLDPPGPERGGRVSLGRNLRYSWHVSSPATPSARLLGVNHDVYARDSAGNVVLNQVQVLMHVSAGPSPGTLTVVSDTDAPPWISPGTYPVSVSTFFPMWSRATLGLSPSR